MKDDMRGACSTDGEIKISHIWLEDLKGKGKVVPLLNRAPRHEDVLGEWRYSFRHSLTSALDGGEWLATRGIYSVKFSINSVFNLSGCTRGVGRRTGQVGFLCHKLISLRLLSSDAHGIREVTVDQSVSATCTPDTHREPQCKWNRKPF